MVKEIFWRALKEIAVDADDRSRGLIERLVEPSLNLTAGSVRSVVGKDGVARVAETEDSDVRRGEMVRV